MRKPTTVALAVLAALALATGCSGTVATGSGHSIKAAPSPTSSAPTPSDTAAEEIPVADVTPAALPSALDAVTLKTCKANNDFGFAVEAKGTVRSTADTRQDLALQIEALNSSGDRIADLYGFADNVAPGQVVAFEALSMDDLDEAAEVDSCRVIGVVGLDAE